MERTQKSRFLGVYSVYTVLSHGRLLIYTLSFKIYINVANQKYALLCSCTVEHEAQPRQHRTRHIQNTEEEPTAARGGEATGTSGHRGGRCRVWAGSARVRSGRVSVLPLGVLGCGEGPNATRKHQEKFPSSDFQVLHAFSSLENQTIEEVKGELNDRQVLPGRNPRGKRRRSGGGAWEQQQVHEAPLRAREAPATRSPHCQVVRSSMTKGSPELASPHRANVNAEME